MDPDPGSAGERLLIESDDDPAFTMWQVRGPRNGDLSDSSIAFRTMVLVTPTACRHFLLRCRTTKPDSAITTATGERWHTHLAPESPPQFGILQAGPDQDGRLWLGMRFGGVLRYDSPTEQSD